MEQDKVNKRIGILFGGPSGEHEVSIQSGLNIYRALDATKYEKVLIGMDHDGNWRVDVPGRPLLVDKQGKDFLQQTAPTSGPAVSADAVRINPNALMVLPTRSATPGTVELHALETNERVGEIDIFFPIAHGSFGEDGCLQGVLKGLNAPFVGAGVLGSSVGMDKDVMKRLLRDAKIPGPRFVTVRAKDREQTSFDVLEKTLGLPLFVKPCNMGSSVGIHRVTDAPGFHAAIAEAFAYDTKVIIEENVRGRELECAVLGNDYPEASLPGEVVVASHTFYSYEAKYIDDTVARTMIPADLDAEKMRELRALAVKTYETLECAGLARVDFFLREDGVLLVNEINTLPGFTKISMFPKMWEATGIPQVQLLDKLVELAFDRHTKEMALKRTY
jgi:D-alanine-D-alanine ligase